MSSSKVVFFQVRWYGHHQDDAMCNFFPDSKRSILWLSNEVSFMSEFLWDGDQNRQSFSENCTQVADVPAHCSKVIGRGDKIFRPIQSKSITIPNKLNILESFLSRCDQCTLHMNAGIIEFVRLEQVLLVKLKNVSAHQAKARQPKLQRNVYLIRI